MAENREALPRQFEPGDVIAYSPAGSSHAREGTAVVLDSGSAMDTFWGDPDWSNDGHILSVGELATADLRWNLASYRKLGAHWENKRDEWMTYAPADRQVITAQHGLQRTYFIRIGAEPDVATQIENARELVAEAERQVEAAKRTLQWRRQDLTKLEVGAHAL